MPLLCPLDGLEKNHQIVICDSEISMQAHKYLFHFGNNAYLKAGTEDIFDAVASVIDHCNSESSCSSGHSIAFEKIHLSLKWENMLRVCLWSKATPTIGDAFTLLRNAGISSEELQPFKTSADVNDIFPWLYYGKKFDVLKKICHSAKKQAEIHIKSHSVRVNCHLVAEETRQIVASSL